MKKEVKNRKMRIKIQRKTILLRMIFYASSLFQQINLRYIVHVFNVEK